MNSPLKGKDYVSLTDYTAQEFQFLLDLAIELKDKQKRGVPHTLLQG